MTAALMGAGLLPLALAGTASAQNPVGQGFNLNAGDLRFILNQIKISENHVQALTAAGSTNTNPCVGLRGDGPNQIPTGTNGDTLPWGLRTVDGSCNNLVAGQDRFGQADQVFPRRVGGVFQDADTGDPDGPGPAPEAATSYKQKSGTVLDSQPRDVSNLVVDQNPLTNPAADAAAPSVEDGREVHERTGTVFIPNEAPDVGLSAPFNSTFTLFGQFFDHGLDLVTKGGSGTVVVPLRTDDPLYDPASRTNFMVLTRATNQPGPDGQLGTADDVQEHTNTTTPFIDQNQTYTSHPAHQVFLREYADTNADPALVAPANTGRLVEEPEVGGMATWGRAKQQAAEVLGVALSDTDAVNAPLVATDPYGHYIPGPNGFPQLVVLAADGSATLVEGNPAAPVATTDAARTGHAFLDDIAHHAAPGMFDADHDPATPAVPKTPDGDGGTTDDGDPASYDDEMLNAHFIAGDGRANENIGLTAIHHVFHAEHNRLTTDLDSLIGTLPVDVQNEWRTLNPASGWDYGERLFQAARFVTEMEYQHLAFEEFGRKVQPMVNLFGEGGTGYRTDLNPAIKAEFAHAVYRFGHSMLNETVARTNPDGSNRDIDLIDAFLNPPEFRQGGTLTPGEAAGSVIAGMSRQVGNEIDEFVTGALRNNLLGLPLDLATINMARARDTGTPSLNSARTQFFGETQNAALKPYESWMDFGFNLKHRESLVNFVAAYGTHPTITGAQTLADKRAAAQLLVDPPADADPATIPHDAYAFMFSTTQEDLVDTPEDESADWTNQGGASRTGVDDIDLWIGGLAEKRFVFGGLLGSTFNYVFELQMEDLQFGDRFYYLSRTAGLNLLTQLEGNSLAEMISRNTSASGLPADVFSRPAFVFDVAKLGTSGRITDDPATEWNEAELLTRLPDGTIRYTGPEHVVWNGTPNQDKIYSSEGDDTLRGTDGPDRLEGGDGVDNHIGGLGDDILTDLFGDDTLKGGDGDDALSSGQGFGGDLNQGGRGSDFVYGGNDMTETFAGPDNDFVFAGDGEDTVFGDDGDDWIEGGAGPFNLLQGDSGTPFADDPNGGHDVLDGDGGEQDFDAEGGDDIMKMGAGIQRAEGMLGFDWTTHKDDPQAADSDMNITGLLPPSVETLRDRFDLVESLSGWNLNDTLRGDDRIGGPEGEDPEGTITDGHTLTQDGINRIAGLQDLLGAGVTSFNAGNIIIGGDGDDLIEGRGGDDRIDGDKWLNVRLIVVDANGNPTGRSADSMAQLQQDVFSGLLDPGNIRIAREIVQAEGPDNDTALFSGNQADYDITFGEGGVVTVNHARGTATDGVDTITNVEVLRFADGTVDATPNQAGTADATLLDLGTNPAVPGNPARLTPQENAAITVNTAAIVDPDGTTGSVFTFQWQQRQIGQTEFANVADHPSAPGRGTAQTFTPLQAGPGFPGEVGRELRVVVSYTDAGGTPEVVTSVPQVVGDVYQGTTANNWFTGTPAEDAARLDAGADNVNTGDGNDLVAGDAGDDTINTGLGDDVIEFTGSGDGFDSVAGAAGADKIVARSDGTVIGLRGTSAMTSVEQVDANGFAGVRIQGSPLADTLSFSTVTLTGIVGIDGGAGDDVINGSAGNDTLGFRTGMGSDRINGFDADPAGGQDLLDVSGLGVTTANFADRVTIVTSNGNTIITVRDAPGGTVLGTIRLNGVTAGSGANQVDQSDFVPNP